MELTGNQRAILGGSQGEYLARCNPEAAQFGEFVASVRERHAPVADAAEAVEDIGLVERIVETLEVQAGQKERAQRAPPHGRNGPQGGARRTNLTECRG